MTEIATAPAGDDEDLVRQRLQLLRQRRHGLGALEHPGDVPDLGRHSGRGHYEARPRRGSRWCSCTPCRYGRRAAVSTFSTASTLLPHGHALARERRFGDLERGGLHQPAVGGNEVAGLDRDDVARHELLAPGSARAAPSRRTRAFTIIIFCSAATASCGLAFLAQPEHALKSVSTRSTMPGGDSFTG